MGSDTKFVRVPGSAIVGSFCCTKMTLIKVPFLLFCGVICLGNRINHRRFVFPTEDHTSRHNNVDPSSIFFPGSHGPQPHSPPEHPAHSPPEHPPHSPLEHPPHSPPEHPPHSQNEPEISDFPGVPRTFPSPKPACALNLNCDAPCETDQDYNATIRTRIDTLINSRGGANSIFKNPIFNALLEEVNTAEEEGLGTRFRMGAGIIETPVCAGKEVIFYPERAKTKDNDWAFVLNQGEYKQGIKYEKCITNGTKCNLGSAGLEIETVCRQKYIYKKMLVMDSQGSKLLPESVWIPSCCVCYRMERFGRVASRNVSSTNDTSINDGCQ